MRPEADESAADRELLARHVAGDREAFGLLVARHRDRLWRVALRTLGDPEDAADAVQDALVSAVRAAAGFRGDAAVTTWLHRIVVNACLDLARRKAVRTTVPLDPEHTEQAAVDLLGQRETASEVLAALRRLPVEQAAALVLVDVEGYPVAEAAAILEVPEGTVKSRCARGRARLAELLAHLGPVTPDHGETGSVQRSDRNRQPAVPVEPTPSNGPREPQEHDTHPHDTDRNDAQGREQR
jgi:RNA polymerase sigma-70 factor, ECF subfamily